MYTDNDLLDAPTSKPQKLPLAIVTFEKYLFPILFAIQYISLIQIFSARGLEALLGIIAGGGAQFIIGVWQVVIGIVKFASDSSKQHYKTYLIAAATNILLIFIALMTPNSIIILFLLFLLPHAIAWYYWWIAKQDSAIRQQALGG